MATPSFRPIALAALTAIAASIGISTAAYAAGELNLYTTREPGLIEPILQAFEKNSGIKVNTVFVKDGLLERAKAEGPNSPADVFMVVDIGNLLDLVDAGVTQAIQSEALTTALPANLHSANNDWFSLSLRDRVLYADKDLKISDITYEDLADPKWKGKICIRAGQHPYNTALIASMIAHDGAEATEKWLQGVKANLARKATGGDRDVARDILGGICDVGIANNYYVGRMKTAEPGSENRQWGDAIQVIRPTFAKSGGTHVNITGASVAKNAPNKDNAVALLEYLVSVPAQELYANANFEYPIREGVKLHPVTESFGALKVDPLPLADIAKYRKQASELVDKVGFDN